MGLYMGNVIVEQRFIGAEEDTVVRGTTDFTDFWANGMRSEIYDNVDTSDGVIFDRALASNSSLEKLPKYLKVTDKAVSIESMFEECRLITTLPNEFDISNVSNAKNAFRNCGIANFPQFLNFSNAVSMENTFYRQYGSGIVTMPKVVDMSNAETANSMCYNARITTFPFKNTGTVTAFRNAFTSCWFTEAELDLTSCTDMRNCFDNCTRLTTLTLRNTQNITSAYWNYCFKSCSALINLSIDCLNVTGNQIDFSTCTKLSVESLVNILNALSDNTGISTTYTVKLGATNLKKLTAEQKAIATNKNINLT